MLAHLCRGPVPKANFRHPSPSLVLFQTHWCTRRYSVPAVSSICVGKMTKVPCIALLNSSIVLPLLKPFLDL